MSSQKKNSPPTFAPANGLASSQVTHQLQFPTTLQSHLHSPQEKQQSQPVCPWSAHAPPFGHSQSPFLRSTHALFPNATVAGELFLFGGWVESSKSLSNDLYVISTRDFSSKLLKTSGDVPEPRYGHCAVLTSSTLLVWGGGTDLGGRNEQDQRNDDSFYLLNLVSREWTRIVVNGPGPGGRYNHTMTLVDSKLFVFGGRVAGRRLNDIWALDLNCLKSDPFWESYEPTPGDEKPPPRSGHVSVTIGNQIIISGGCDDLLDFNDVWSFNISTRKWTELQCTGSIPPPRAAHAAVIISDVMYVYGGSTYDETRLGDLIALNLSTQRWTAFQDIGPSPGSREGHAMASDGRSVFVLGGTLSPGARVDKAKLIYVLDTKLLIYPKPDSNTVRNSTTEKTTERAQKLSEGHPIQGQALPQIFSSSDDEAAHGAFPSQLAPSEDVGRLASRQITSGRAPSLNGSPLGPTDENGRPRRVPEEDDDAKLMAPDAPSGREIAQPKDDRLIELERQLSETLVAKTERDQRIAQLTNELALKSALLEQTAEEKKRAGLELRELQEKLSELLLSRDHALAQAQSASQKATSRITEADERSQRKLAELHAKLEARDFELVAVRLRLTDAEKGAKGKADAETYCNQDTTGLVSTDKDQVVHMLLERNRAMEAEIAMLRRNEKSCEMMECRNEG